MNPPPGHSHAPLPGDPHRLSVVPYAESSGTWNGVVGIALAMFTIHTAVSYGTAAAEWWRTLEEMRGRGESFPLQFCFAMYVPLGWAVSGIALLLLFRVRVGGLLLVSIFTAAASVSAIVAYGEYLMLSSNRISVSEVAWTSSVLVNQVSNVIAGTSLLWMVRSTHWWAGEQLGMADEWSLLRQLLRYGRTYLLIIATWNLANELCWLGSPGYRIVDHTIALIYWALVASAGLVLTTTSRANTIAWILTMMGLAVSLAWRARSVAYLPVKVLDKVFPLVIVSVDVLTSPVGFMWYILLPRGEIGRGEIGRGLRQEKLAKGECDVN